MVKSKDDPFGDDLILMDHFSSMCVRVGLSPRRTSVAGFEVYLFNRHDTRQPPKLLGLVHCTWGVEAIKLDGDPSDWSNRIELDLSDHCYAYNLFKFLGVPQHLIDECETFDSLRGL